MEISWQVTGIRKDAWANANRVVVEEGKQGKERGRYLSPELFGQPKETGIHYRWDIQRSQIEKEQTP